jgi:hypothetical protein
MARGVNTRLAAARTTVVSSSPAGRHSGGSRLAEKPAAHDST